MCADGKKRHRGSRGQRKRNSERHEWAPQQQAALSPQEERELERIRSMRQLARSGAPMELLWAIQQNQIRQQQIVLCNRQQGPRLLQQIDELGRAIQAHDIAIREQAQASGWGWLVERHCRTPCSHEATAALTRELYVVQQELQRQQCL